VSDCGRSISIPNRQAAEFGKLSMIPLLEINDLAQTMVWRVNCFHLDKPICVYRFPDWRL